MHLITSRPGLSSMVRPIAPLATIALCLSGCSSLDGVSSGASSSFVRYPSSSKYYVTAFQFVDADREYLDRYACASEKPLVCECLGRVSSSCSCRC